MILVLFDGYLIEAGIYPHVLVVITTGQQLLTELGGY
jgi:hypothetical protein